MSLEERENLSTLLLPLGYASTYMVDIRIFLVKYHIFRLE